MWEKGSLSFQGENETITPDFPEKMTVFPSFDLTFPLIPL